jgi:heme/copper-type cytochrome/quinol oxidase subunit 1
MSSCCGSSDIVGDSFADIIRGIAHLPKAVRYEYVNISEVNNKSNVLALCMTVIIVAGVLVFAFKLILTWSCNSIGCSRIYTAQGGNTITAISSSAEETNGHAPLKNVDYISST